MLAEETRELVESLAQYVSKRDWLEIDLDDDGTAFIVNIYMVDGLGRKAYCSAATRSWAKTTPGAKEINESGMVGNAYYMPTGFLTVLRCIHAFGDRMKFLSEDAAALWSFNLQQFAAGVERAQINAAWETNRTVPECSIPVADGVELMPYQKVAAHMATLGTSFAFFMEQGTGKTPAAISTMCKWIEQSTGFQRIVVVCPRNVVPNWIVELKAFSPLPIKTAIIRGTEIARIGKLAEVMRAEPNIRAGIAVINYDCLISMGEIFANIRWDQLILDEAHAIKSHQSKRTKYFLHRLRDQARYRLILTGTPIANTAMDLWSQLEFLGPSTSGFGTFKGYKDFYARIMKNQETGFDQIVGMQHIPVLQEVLARNSFIIRKKDAMPWLPEKTYSVESIEMTPRQRDMYRQIATQLAVEIEDTLDSQTENRQLLINNVLTKLLKLAQVTSGFVMWDPVITPEGVEVRPRVLERLGVNPKIEWCVEAVKQLPLDEKVLFWSWMIPDITALSERLAEEGIKHVKFIGAMNDEAREAATAAFNTDPECRVFIGNPGAGGAGLNLLGHDPKNPDAYQTDATLSVYIAQNWNAVHRMQSEDRNHRKGTRKPTHIVTLLCEDTIDEDIHERVSDKRQAALEIGDIKNILQKLRGDIQ